MKIKKLLALLLCAVMLFSFAGCSALSFAEVKGWFGIKDYRLVVLDCCVTDADGNVYLVTTDGKKTALKENEDAALSADQKTALVIDEKEHTARILTVKSGKSKTVAIDDDRIIKEMYLEDDFLSADTIGFYVTFYKDSSKQETEREYWVWSFKYKKFVVKLNLEDENDNYAFNFSKTGITALAYIRDGALYTYVIGEKGPEKRCSIEENAVLQGVSANGRAVIWYERTTTSDGQNTDTIRMLYKKKTIDVATVKDVRFFSYSVDCSKDGNYTVIYDGDKFYQVKKGKVKSTVSLPTEGGNNYFDAYTDTDLLQESKGNTKGFYTEINNSLYYITLSGNKTKIKTDIDRFGFEIKKGHIQYIKDGSLYVAKIKKGELKNETKLKSEVNDLGTFSADGKYLYFKTKDEYLSATAEFAYGTLFAYRFGSDSAKKVASDVRWYLIDTNGKKAVYAIDDGSKHGYTLKKYTYRSDKSETIAEEVNGLNSNIYYYDGDDYINVKSFYYYEYSYAKDGKTYYTVKYYNGKKSTTVLEDVS